MTEENDERCAEIFMRALREELAGVSAVSVVLGPLLRSQPTTATPQELVEVVGQTCETDPAFSQMLEAIMTKRITDPEERELMGLPPRNCSL